MKPAQFKGSLCSFWGEDILKRTEREAMKEEHDS